MNRYRMLSEKCKSQPMYFWETEGLIVVVSLTPLTSKVSARETSSMALLMHVLVLWNSRAMLARSRDARRGRTFDSCSSFTIELIAIDLPVYCCLNIGVVMEYNMSIRCHISRVVRFLNNDTPSCVVFFLNATSKHNENVHTTHKVFRTPVLNPL